MVIKSIVGAARARRAVSWEMVKNVPSCLVKTLSIFTFHNKKNKCTCF